MPTAGWILEGARDRFLDGTSTVPDPGPALAPRFACPFCRASFSTTAELRRHSNDHHVGTRPFMVLGGAEPASTDTIRKAFRASDISLFNTTAVRISYDGSSFEECSDADVGKQLSARPNRRAAFIGCGRRHVFLGRTGAARQHAGDRSFGLINLNQRGALLEVELDCQASAFGKFVTRIAEDAFHIPSFR